MLTLTSLLILAVAFVAGVMGSLLGLGGGVVIVPALSLFFGAPIHAAIGASGMGFADIRAFARHPAFELVAVSPGPWTDWPEGAMPAYRFGFKRA